MKKKSKSFFQVPDNAEAQQKAIQTYNSYLIKNKCFDQVPHTKTKQLLLSAKVPYILPSEQHQIQTYKQIETEGSSSKWLIDKIEKESQKEVQFFQKRLNNISLQSQIVKRKLEAFNDRKKTLQKVQKLKKTDRNELSIHKNDVTQQQMLAQLKAKEVKENNEKQISKTREQLLKYRKNDKKFIKNNSLQNDRQIQHQNQLKIQENMEKHDIIFEQKQKLMQKMKKFHTQKSSDIKSEAFSYLQSQNQSIIQAQKQIQQLEQEAKTKQMQLLEQKKRQKQIQTLK